MGVFSILFFQKLQFRDNDSWSKDHEALCQYHVDDANTRALCVFGIPAVLLILISIGSLIVSVIGIAAAIKDVSFDPVLEPY